MKFRPEEVIFSHTTDCNLNCPHCVTPKSKKTLSSSLAKKFLRECRALGIERVGFSGGEPFLRPAFLANVARSAVSTGMNFDRIITNGVWFKNTATLDKTLKTLFDAGYDGSIVISVDAFHRQDLRKAAAFVKAAVNTWGRKDIVSIACVTGSRERLTRRILARLAAYLGARLIGAHTGYPRIRSKDLFLKIYKIDLAALGNAGPLKKAWDGRWFKEDICKGPGNIFFVMPDGAVKPCCGYASDLKGLTIGNIKNDSASSLMEKFKLNRFAVTVFSRGLTEIRKRLERRGVKLPGKTSNICVFCYHVQKNIPKGVLRKCLY